MSETGFKNKKHIRFEEAMSCFFEQFVAFVDHQFPVEEEGTKKIFYNFVLLSMKERVNDRFSD